MDTIPTRAAGLIPIDDNGSAPWRPPAGNGASALPRPGAGGRRPASEMPPRLLPAQYADWECLEDRNAYGDPIVDPGHYEGIHYPAIVPRGGDSPPVCSCGWTRFNLPGRRFVELVEHIADQGELGSLTVPVTRKSTWR